jgi:hypothetical protein
LLTKHRSCSYSFQSIIVPIFSRLSVWITISYFPSKREENFCRIDFRRIVLFCTRNSKKRILRVRTTYNEYTLPSERQVLHYYFSRKNTERSHRELSFITQYSVMNRSNDQPSEGKQKAKKLYQKGLLTQIAPIEIKADSHKVA